MQRLADRLADDVPERILGAVEGMAQAGGDQPLYLERVGTDEDLR